MGDARRLSFDLGMPPEPSVDAYSQRARMPPEPNVDAQSQRARVPPAPNVDAHSQRTPRSQRGPRTSTRVRRLHDNTFIILLATLVRNGRNHDQCGTC